MSTSPKPNTPTLDRISLTTHHPPPEKPPEHTPVLNLRIDLVYMVCATWCVPHSPWYEITWRVGESRRKPFRPFEGSRLHIVVHFCIFERKRCLFMRGIQFGDDGIFICRWESCCSNRGFRVVLIRLFVFWCGILCYILVTKGFLKSQIGYRLCFLKHFKPNIL